jgi:hypothetical protein
VKRRPCYQLWFAATALLCLNGASLAQETVSSPQIAIIGDSYNTGVATHPDLSFDEKLFGQLFSGKKRLEPTAEQIEILNREGGLALTAPLAPPVRLNLSTREYAGPLSWLVYNAMHVFSRVYFDVEEFSWGYLLGQAMGIRPEQILIAAENGARSTSAMRQIDRVLDHTGGALPRHIFYFFSGNDLCGPSMEYVSSSLTYRDSLMKSLRYMIRNGTVGPDGVDVWLLDPIGIMQITQVDSILNKTVPAHGKTMSCRELQHYTKAETAAPAPPADEIDPLTSLIVGQFPKSPAFYCPTVLGHGLDSKEKESSVQLANRLRSYRDEIEKVVQDINKNYLPAEQRQKFRVRRLKETGLVALGAQDIANDCFHLSLHGNMRLAKTILEATKSPSQNETGAGQPQ